MTPGSPSGFERYIGIDYSGAATPDTGLSGLRVYAATADEAPREIRPHANPRLHWSRRGIAEWLLATLTDAPPTLVGIDHGFGLPRIWHTHYGVTEDYTQFLRDFRRDWPSDHAGTSVEAIRRGRVGAGSARQGSARWRRLAEARVGAKSVFHFDVPGSVAKSTHAGLPWLAMLRETLGPALHFWPFDGWLPAPGRALIAEAYPSLWRCTPAPAGHTADQHDAWVISATLRRLDRDGQLPALLAPALDPETRETAMIEGWILGVT